ncbi:unnamed protein product [Triticum turgidum subsp. durum]|uniref:Uncharacterized protein n=1 Tax=Triticum turgidum subsp. durum TaxID=4567 RepID=A0A9R1RSC9_TRITD|nr:unnamed protein product [Triticum turgidum subsp. durum]
MTYLFTFHMASQGAAVSLVELGEYQKASDLLEKLVKVIPEKAEAYRLLGEVKFELKDYDGSSSSYRNSLSSSDSIDFDVLRGLTNSLVAAKKPDQAVEVILSCRRKLSEKRQTRQPDLEAANENGGQEFRDIDPIQVDLLLGKAYSDWGHISDAVTVYDNLITEHPEDFRGYLAKGAILKQNGKAGDAERMFIQVLSSFVISPFKSMFRFCLWHHIPTVSMSTGLKINYYKSVMVPNNTQKDRVELSTSPTL